LSTHNTRQDTDTMAGKKNGKMAAKPQKAKTFGQKVADAAKSVAKSAYTRPLGAAAMQMLDSRGYDHARMFYDPCHAPLKSSSYKGETGYTNRFTSDYTVTILASGELFLGLIPSGFWYAINSNAVGGNTYTVTAGQSVVPGYTFCTTNAARYRVVSACITVTPLGTLTSQTGQVWFGNIGARELVSDAGVATARTVANLQQLLPENITAASIINGGLDVKWVPSHADEWYTGVNNAGTGVDISDVNGLALVGTGLPNASTVNIRTTVIIEWIPAPGVGIASDPTDFPPPSRTSVWDVLGWLKRRDAKWWFNHAGKVAYEAGKTAIGMLPGASVVKSALQYAVS